MCGGGGALKDVHAGLCVHVCVCARAHVTAYVLRSPNAWVHSRNIAKVRVTITELHILCFST